MKNIKFNYTVEDINNIKNNIINDFEIFKNNIHIYDSHNNVELSPEELFNSYIYTNDKFDTVYNLITFLQNVSQYENIRYASINFEKDLNEYYRNFFKEENNYNIFFKLKKLISNDDKNNSDIKSRSKIIKNIFKIFESNGVHLNETKKNNLNIINKTLEKYENEFMQNIYNDKKKLIIKNKSELNGVNNEFMKNVYDKKLKKYIIGTSYPEQEEILRYCNSQSIRKKYYKLVHNIAYPKNMKVLQKILELRNKKSRILGYKNNVDYQLSYNRLSNEKKINNLLNKLLPKLLKNGKIEYDNILKYFNNESFNKISNNKINTYDFAYYSNKYKEQKYNLNSNIIKEYFPLNNVIKKVFNMYEKIFSIKFTKINKIKKENTWHKDVMLYAIYDNVNLNKNKNKNNKKLILHKKRNMKKFILKNKNKYKNKHKNKKAILGYLYLDLFPRDNKFNHAATFDLQSSYINSDNKRIVPVTAVVCNFERKFMTHSNLTTFCHEMGHALHNIFSMVKYSSLSGTKTELDFVETISQFFENWCWEKDFLKYVSKHYKTNKPLGDDLINKIIKNKNYNNAIHYLTQILYIKYDLTVHKKTQYSIKELHDIWFKITDEVLPFFKYESNVRHHNYNSEIYPMCSFGHIVGYDVGYYSYLWSIIYSYNIFSKFQKYGLFSNKVGMDLRRKIMEKGSTKTGLELLKDFLKGNPSEKYFINNIF
jgi:Zn-dependent oligopeptidase